MKEGLAITFDMLMTMALAQGTLGALEEPSTP